MASLNTLFVGGILLAVLCMATKSYQASGSLAFLMMGCGALFVGLGSLMAGWTLPMTGNPNSVVTLHNIGCLFAGFCHLASAHYLLADLVGTHPSVTRSRHVAIPYGGILVFLCVVAVLEVQGRLPAFFVPGVGASMLRQFVLGGALWMFALSGSMFVGIYFTAKTQFAYWYGLALLLFATGLAGIFLQKSVGGALGWVGRSAQYLGSVYFLFALLAGRREMGQASGSEATTNRWGLWPYLEQRVKERTLALEKTNEALQREILERKWAELALRESEEKYRQLFEVEADAMALADAETGRFIDANAAVLKLYGYSRQEFLSLKISDITAEPVKTFQALAQRQTFIPLRWQRKKDGSVFPVEITRNFFHLHGREVGVAVVHDLTARRQAEEALRRSETKFRTLYYSTSDAVLMMDEKGFLDCNPVALGIFGCASREEFRSKHPADLSPPVQPDGTDSLTLANRQIAIALEKGSNHFEWMHKRADTGAVFAADVLLSAMELDGKRFLQATVRDITERKRAEEELRASHQELRALAARIQAVREEERTHVAREIHDVLAQELTRLKIDVVLLARHLAQPPGELERILIREKLAAMTITTDIAIQSVQKIAAELRPAVLDSLGLGAAMEWQTEEFQARTAIPCQLHLPSKDLLLESQYSTALFRILQESLTNVARHAEATQVEVHLKCEAGYVTLTIQDNGRGIQESEANAPEASGLLGLRERATLLGGSCEIRGRPGEGTTVEARIPLPGEGNSEDRLL
jgi:PAS domain S-box-containing protein